MVAEEEEAVEDLTEEN
jgi:hypothetical protein